MYNHIIPQSNTHINMAIDLRKLNTKHNTVVPQQARVSRDTVVIPYYYVVNGNVITNLRDAREYNSEYKTVR
jgi:hypothetical protein